MNERLFHELQGRANERGVVLVRAGVLQDKLHIPLADLKGELERLATTGRLEILTFGPFLALALRGAAWSSSGAERRKDGPKTGAAPVRAYSFKSSLSPSKPLNKESHRQSNSEEDLLQEILATLGEIDPTTFRGALRRYSPDVIRLTLERVRRMKHIEKSRTALFRFLLPRIATESFTKPKN